MTPGFLATIIAFPPARLVESLFNGRKVARPAFRCASQRIASAATSSESTTTEVIAPPNAVASAVSCSESIGAHNSAMVPMMPLISPRSRAPRMAAAPPAMPLELDLFSNSARAERSCRSVSVIFFSTAADSSRRRDSARSASRIS